jgi:AraC family transcriptional regulator, transcriptional activator of pobA
MSGVNQIKQELGKYKYIDEDFTFLNFNEFRKVKSSFFQEHLFYHIIFITDGIGKIEIDGETLDVCPNKIVMVTPFASINNLFDIDKKLNGFIVSINIALVLGDNHFLQPIMNDGKSCENFGVIKYDFQNEEAQGTFAFHVLNQLLDLLTESKKLSQFDSLYTNEMIKTFWLTICDLQNSQLNRIINRIPLENEILEFHHLLVLMNEEMMHTHNMADIENKMHLDSATIKTICLKYSNNTPKMIFQKVIICRAKYLLKYTSYSLKEISYEIGFSLATNFNKFFSKHEEMTPLEYRNLFRIEARVEQFA